MKDFLISNIKQTFYTRNVLFLLLAYCIVLFQDMDTPKYMTLEEFHCLQN